MNTRFTLHRWWAIVVKEFIQMRRDRLTFGMIIGIPLLQLTLFGFAINSDPKSLPTAILQADHSPHARTLLNAIRYSGYFQVVSTPETEAELATLLRQGEIQFALIIPPNFSRDLVRGERPVVLLQADATDPAATSNALAALTAIVQTSLDRDFQGALGFLHSQSPAVELRTHRLYNPEGITQYNIVPGLMGVVLTMTMVMITALAITRERERGTMENLLAMPVRPLEVMMGKIVPYIMIGYIQVALILLAARLLFNVPMLGSIWLLLIVSMIFIAANLAVGITYSTIARNQLQAMQMAFFFFLPSLLLSGFMFPFRGMPNWAQIIGECLPLTHFLRLVRGILLKGNGIADSIPHLIPIVIFTLVVIMIGTLKYRETLD
ncbi:ABC transporter permease [Beggiatoa leptomitoformis]|uniref:ABC transporter permease n=1 Tax=Beggiatoa leptomitoformis TaxID=288004 RepID=A0A2N9YC73_9GAMM|nr:ABC transporter permease [Beggiatoa leptomitoformis]ALG66665.1 ABC transporter permease [Beggiatoa leptomitoformis]AUI68014.1 ABC transporter permease [Beggiatoa leptomitoformis]